MFLEQIGSCLPLGQCSSDPGSCHPVPEMDQFDQVHTSHFFESLAGEQAVSRGDGGSES